VNRLAQVGKGKLTTKQHMHVVIT